MINSSRTESSDAQLRFIAASERASLRALIRPPSTWNSRTTEFASTGSVCVRWNIAEPTIGEYRPDLIVENTVVVEIKSVLRMEAVFTAQLLTYLRITGLHVGLLLNFNQNVLKEGIKRVVR